MARYVKAVRMRETEDPEACRYCGTRYGVDTDEEGRKACRATSCLGCGVRVCMSNGLGSGSCPVCYFGLLAGWSGAIGPCQRVRCDNVRVALERRRYVCGDHSRTDFEAAKLRAAEGKDTYGRPLFYYVADEIERIQEATSQEIPAL